jgi:VanZ family protein
MTKIIFHLLNIIFVFLYIYPGSLLGFFIYGDILRQPQITSNFIVSSNHVYAFLLLSLLGLISYFNSLKIVILYLILISIILELLHLFIPNRSFQFSDLFGNIVGVLIPVIILILFNFWRKNEFI